MVIQSQKIPAEDTFVMFGGQGSRLYALTQKLAKPAVPFGGKYRIIDFPLSNCVNSGIDTVGILGLLLEFRDSVCLIRHHQAEAGSLLPGNLHDGHAEFRVLLLVEFQEIAVVLLADLAWHPWASTYSTGIF